MANPVESCIEYGGRRRVMHRRAFFLSRAILLGVQVLTRAREPHCIRSAVC
jgi:hypothetical protein